MELPHEDLQCCSLCVFAFCFLKSLGSGHCPNVAGRVLQQQESAVILLEASCSCLFRAEIMWKEPCCPSEPWGAPTGCGRPSLLLIAAPAATNNTRVLQFLFRADKDSFHMYLGATTATTMVGNRMAQVGRDFKDHLTPTSK